MSFYNMLKRSFDIVISFIGIVVLIPVFILLSIWVKFSSKGPVIYKHTRIGKDKKPFEIYKFRSMVVGARSLQEKRVSDDVLITSAGRFMRKTFLDETAQLFNILKGDISLVGPRPLDEEFYNRLIKKNNRWEEILKIKPGLTSLESVADYMSEKNRVKFEKKFEGLVEKDVAKDIYEHRLILDLYYVNHESFLLDAEIVFYTFMLMMKKIFLGKKK